MEIYKFEQFIAESAKTVATKTPFESVLDNQGRILASLPTFKDDDTDFMMCPKYEFTFTNMKNVKEFEDTTYSNDFWKAIYDYDGVMHEKNDYKAIDKNMKKFGNKIVGKKLYIYCYDKKDSIELQQRCEVAKDTCHFDTVKYIE